MPKDDLVYVGHMLETAQKAVSKAQAAGRTGFDSDENLRLALTHLIQIIGEAAGRVSREFCAAHPEIEWKAATGMRHKVVHDYMNVDEEVVWQTAISELPLLIAALEKLLPPDATSAQ